MTIQSGQSLTKEQAIPKLKQYCAYQERCHQEVKEKLYSYGLHKKDVEEIISGLIEENYLNEERFAVQYAGGKFRMKQWGKVKIKHALKQKQVSDYCIRKALLAIDDAAYWQCLQKQAATKSAQLKKENPFVKKHKLQQYLLQKGYEADLIREMIKLSEE